MGKVDIEIFFFFGADLIEWQIEEIFAIESKKKLFQAYLVTNRQKEKNFGYGIEQERVEMGAEIDRVVKYWLGSLKSLGKISMTKSRVEKTMVVFDSSCNSWEFGELQKLKI